MFHSFFIHSVSIGIREVSELLLKIQMCLQAFGAGVEMFMTCIRVFYFWLWSPFQLPSNIHPGVNKSYSSTWVSNTHMGDPDWVRGPGFGLFWPCLLQVFGDWAVFLIFSIISEFVKDVKKKRYVYFNIQNSYEHCEVGISMNIHLLCVCKTIVI